MPFMMKPLLHDQIMEMQRKIQVLEDDRAAFYESSQSTLKMNREIIRQLRQENDSLRKKVANANTSHDNLIKDAIRQNGLEKYVCRHMTGQAALATLERKALSKMKHVNGLKDISRTLQRHLEELKDEYQRRKAAGSCGPQSADARFGEKEEDAMKLRALENSLEKMQLKRREAENIMKHYEKLKSHMQEESLTFPGQLDSLEAEILKHREELHKMHAMNNNAQLYKEAAKIDLQQQEELLSKKRKERERIIASYRKKVEESKAQVEKAERRAQRTTLQPDELSSEAQRSTPMVADEEEKAVVTFEEAFRRIKEVTGLTGVQKIVERFISQKETHQHLEKLKGENEELLQHLNEQKELLSQQLQDMKYSGEAKLSSDRQMLEESEQRLQAQQQRCDAAKEHLEHLVKALGNVRAGVEHLTAKLQHITLSPEDTVTEVSPDSDEFVVVLMTQCEMKLKALYEELQGKDMAAIMKEMEEDEFYVRIEGKLPAWNTRVKFPEDLSDDEDDSEEDEADIITREELKRQSQLIIDQSKKKPCRMKKCTY